jgi:ferredoxin
MRVWIDQDCCTGAGLCVDHCPELFIVLEDGIGYVRDGTGVVDDPSSPSIPVPVQLEHAAVDAAERCPGECVYLEADRDTVRSEDATDIVDAEIVPGSDD